TFDTPHGGGGPGAGPAAVSARLEPFLPAPLVGYDENEDRDFGDTDRPHSIGRASGCHGNFGRLVRAVAYVVGHRSDGRREVEESPELLPDAPVTTPVRRLDEAKAARELKLRW